MLVEGGWKILQMKEIITEQLNRSTVVTQTGGHLGWESKWEGN